MSTRIPFNKASLTGRETDNMLQAVKDWHISGDGPFTKRCSEFLEREVGTAKALLTTSCTHALEMAALLLDVKEGDEVIIPSYTFVSTANAFVMRGATPVFVDVRRDTLNMDESLLEALITPRTKAIVPVHYAGVGCEMDQISAIAAARNISVVEDNAHGLFGKYKGKFLGTFGTFATQSFHETKNFTCGEGGALLINDEKYVSRAEIIREKGTDRSKFFRGEVNKYGWVDVGSSYLPSEILAAFLYAQLENWKTIQERRHRIWARYQSELAGWAAENETTLPVVPDECDHAAHMFYMVLPSHDTRQTLIKHLRNSGIHAVFHYLPLHKSEFAVRNGFDKYHCPVTEDISDRLLRLPMFNSLSDDDQTDVITAVTSFRVSSR